MNYSLFKKDEEAVSPVIGVILMVAITVILAAVIAAFVFGMGAPEAAPTAQLKAIDNSTANIVTGPDEGILTLQHKGGDPIAIDELKIQVSDDDGSNWFNEDDSEIVLISPSSGTLTVGDQLKIVDGAGSGNISTSGTIKVQVVHKPTNNFLLDTSVQCV